MAVYRIKKNMSIGIVGGGFVGRATGLFKSKNIKIKVYDKEESRRYPKNVKLEDLSKCHLVFVCLPTPMGEDEKCHTKIVEKCIKDLVKSGCKKEDIIIRSTVPIGFCEKHNVCNMPEFLTERNWPLDFKTCPVRLFGVPKFKEYGQSIVNHPTIYKVRNLFKIAKELDLVDSDKIEFTTCDLSEASKLTRNAFLATKISFFNEIYDLCDVYDLNYKALQKMVTYDERIGESHTSVPGYGNKRGFGGTCLPKDLKSLLSSFEDKNIDSYILKNVDKRNDEIDRPDKDWAEDKGRSSI